MPIVIRSGGQTGVDRAALRAAAALGLPYCGWCLRGGWAEDRPEPPGVLADFPRLVETPSAEPAQRTAWNVRDAHATLILARGRRGELDLISPGTRFALQCAELVYVRPCLLADPADPAADAVAGWLLAVVAAAGPGVVLNVAGPRASEDAGIETAAFELLAGVLTV